MKKFLVIVLYISVTTLNAQSLWLKGYIGGDRVKAYSLNVGFNDYSQVYIRSEYDRESGLIPALAIKNKKGSAFFEMSVAWSKVKNATAGIGIKETPSGPFNTVIIGTYNRSYLDFQMDHNWRLIPLKSKRWEVFGGIALNPYRQKLALESQIAQVYSMDDSKIGANFGLLSRLQYSFSTRFLLDINMRIFLIGLDYETSSTNNPAIPAGLRSSSILNLENLTKAGFRVGLAYKLVEKKQEKNEE